MTLNGKMALILRYFIEFCSFRVQCVKVVDKAITYGQFTIAISSSKRLQRDRATPTVQIFYNCNVKVLLQIHAVLA